MGKPSAQPQKRFYVYELRDPRTDITFYVGKGQGNRAWSHERDVASGICINSSKTRRIFEILNDGGKVLVEIVAEYDLESDAFDHEIELIATLPNLTNIMPGGGAPLSEEQVRKRAEARTERIRTRALEVERARLMRDDQLRRKIFAVAGESASKQIEIARWLAEVQQDADRSSNRSRGKRRARREMRSGSVSAFIRS